MKNTYSASTDNRINYRELEREKDFRKILLPIITTPNENLKINRIHQLIGKSEFTFQQVQFILGRLTAANILKRIQDRRYRFEDPIVRSFVIEEIERADKINITS